MTLRLASGQEATWHLPIVVPDVVLSAGVPVGLGQNWGLILALLGGMVGAMWPCLFQLTVYFIPALAGIGMQDTGDVSNRGRQRQVLRAAFFFILGFTLVYTATGAVIGFAAQRFSDSSALDMWQRYFGIGAGIIVIVLALRVAVNARAPLVCKMPVLSWMARSNKKKTAHPMEMMLAGLAFATSCMTCFGSALVIVMVVYVGLAQSAFYGALVLFIFSLGMGIPLVIAAVAMVKAASVPAQAGNRCPVDGIDQRHHHGGIRGPVDHRQLHGRLRVDVRPGQWRRLVPGGRERTPVGPCGRYRPGPARLAGLDGGTWENEEAERGESWGVVMEPDAVRQLIRQGIPRRMPRFQYTLNASEMDDLIAYLKIR